MPDAVVSGPFRGGVSEPRVTGLQQEFYSKSNRCGRVRLYSQFNASSIPGTPRLLSMKPRLGYNSSIMMRVKGIGLLNNSSSACRS